jgi:hypothetical protein
MEDVADRSSINTEPGTQLVGCGTRQVALDQRLGLVGVELGSSLFPVGYLA